ncbi:MAG TPA: hypothetical protein VF765_35900 [Polyangiaceae bacterium]
MRPWLVVPVALAAVAPLVAGGCGTDAYGVSECKQIEEARCRAAAKCPEIPLGNVNHTTGTDVDACIRFYDVACLHGLEVPDPGAPKLNACLQAIQGLDGGTASCSVVEQPWLTSACAWLAPSNIPEASTPAEASPEGGDAATDASDGNTSAEGGD